MIHSCALNIWLPAPVSRRWHQKKKTAAQIIIGFGRQMDEVPDVTISDGTEGIPKHLSLVKLVPGLSALRQPKPHDPTGTRRRWLHLFLGYWGSSTL